MGMGVLPIPYPCKGRDEISIQEALMKTVFSTAFAVALLMSGAALADEARSDDPSKPIELTAAQMDTVTAGVGANNVAFQPWEALLAAGFTLNHNLNSDPGTVDQPNNSIAGVAVPSAVKNSFCFGFCP
jgi:hypothetical protein